MEGKKEMPSSGAEEFGDILKVVSEQIPALIKGIIEPIFSAGKNVGSAAANYYKELKASGMPEEVVLRMTENYANTLADLGKLIREAASLRGGFKIPKKTAEEE